MSVISMENCPICVSIDLPKNSAYPPMPQPDIFTKAIEPVKLESLWLLEASKAKEKEI